MPNPPESRRPPDPDTAALAFKATRGDLDAREALLLHMLPRLEAYLRFKAGPLLRARESVSDLVQTVCREVLADLPAFEPRGTASFEHWVLQQALRKVRSRGRYQRAERRAPGREVDDADAVRWAASLLTPSRHAAAREDLARVESALRDIPDDQRTAVILHRIVGLDYPTIAAEMERSEGAVRNLVYRGLARLAVATAPPSTG